jgi:Flp pilus assembly protein TadD
MPDSNASNLPPPSPEHRRIATGQFERANQVIATGNFDYGIRLLLSCCKLDPANLIYRQRLRQTEKGKYKNNMRGSWLAWLTTSTTRAKLKAAKRTRDYLKVLEHAEQVLAKNPWDTGAQMDMAEAAEVLGLLHVAIWTLEQARQKNPRDITLNRSLARLYERAGNFTQAIALWELIRRAVPTDAEAQTKAKDLAASETIKRGQYEAVVGGQAPSRPAKPAPAAEPGATRQTGSKESPPEAPPKKESNAAITVKKGPVGAASPPPEEPSPEPEPFGPVSDRTANEVARLRARIEADPTNPNPYLQLAWLYRRAGQLDQAREVLHQGLGPTAHYFELTLELADVEIEPFRRNLAIAEEKLKRVPADEETRRVRIRLLKEINTREMDLYRQRADRYPTEMGHRFELGIRLLRAGQIDEAIRELQTARSDPRHHWRALMYLGHCFKARNNWRLARRNFEEALQNVPPHEDAARKEIMFQLAQGCAEANDLASAVDIGHELANLDFAYRDIGRLLDEWQARLQKADVASDK